MLLLIKLISGGKSKEIVADYHYHHHHHCQQIVAVPKQQPRGKRFAAAAKKIHPPDPSATSDNKQARLGDKAVINQPQFSTERVFVRQNPTSKTDQATNYDRQLIRRRQTSGSFARLIICRLGVVGFCGACHI